MESEFNIPHQCPSPWKSLSYQCCMNGRGYRLIMLSGAPDLSSVDHSDAQESHNHGCIAAACFRNKVFSTVYFDDESGYLRVLEDMSECESPTTLIQLIHEADIKTLLLLSTTPIHVIEKIKAEHDQLELVFRPTCDFKTERGLAVASKFGHTDQSRSSSKCHQSLGCLAGLHKYMIEKGFAESAVGIDWCNISTYMSIEMNALEALGIFATEDHPNRHSSDKKDGFSIFQLMNRTRSGVDLDAIKARQDSVELFMDPNYALIAGDAHKLLSKVQNFKYVMRQIKAHPTAAVLTSLLSFLKALLELRDLLFSLPRNSLLETFINLDVNMVRRLRMQIEAIVDFEESRLENRVVVKPRIDSRLDELRTFYQGLPDFLSVVAREVSGKYAGLAVDSLSVVYFPQIGFLLTVPLSETCTIDYLRTIEYIELQFATGKFAYLKDSKTRELDESIGDIHSEIVDTEVEIIVQLQAEICKAEYELQVCAESCYELDCLLSMAEFSKEFNLTRPNMVEEPVLDIRNGRHILAELTTQSFVPNDCKLGGVAVLTGPNSSGKSVFMKQVGIIVFLAHIGCFVPAGSGTTIGLTDKILTRISTKENLAKNESAFSSDLKQVVNIIDEATEQSLVLVDEFGKGTLIGDGVGLFVSLLTWLSQNGTSRTIAITHFHEVYTKNLVERDIIKWWNMSVLYGDEASKKQFECFLYRLEEGPCTQSYGLYCAQLAELPSNIIKRAEELREMFEAEVAPEDIRFASLDPALEREATDLIRKYLC